MKDLLQTGLTFVILIVVLYIGGAIAVMTGVNVDGVLTAANATTPTWFANTKTGAGSAMSTYANFLPVVAIAIVGGIALFYVLSYLGVIGRAGE